MPVNLIEQASEILKTAFDPKDYLLTHATIVCSVDTVDVPNVKLGRVTEEDGFQINRKYSNYRISPETDKFINNNCFVPSTPITMADGSVKPIQDVSVGDEVLTHKGRVRQVVRVMHREVQEGLLEIKVRGSNERLHVTSEHPFYVFQANRECVCCGGPIAQKTPTISQSIGKY